MPEQGRPAGRPAAWSRAEIACLTAILLLAAGARLYLLGDQSLWYGESDRAFIASLPAAQIFAAMAEEGLRCLPLCFLIQRPFVDPFSETMARFPLAWLGVLAVALAAQVGRLSWGTRAGLVSALLPPLSTFDLAWQSDFTWLSLPLFEMPRGRS